MRTPTTSGFSGKKFRSLIRASGILLLSFLAFSCASMKGERSPLDFEAAALFGMVYTTDGEPLQDLNISIDGESAAVSDVNGRFVVPELRRGEHTLTAERDGFEPLILPFSFLNRSQVLYLRLHSLNTLLDLAEKSLEARKHEDARKYLLRAEAVSTTPEPVLLYLKAILAKRTGERAEAERILRLMQNEGYTGEAVDGLLEKVRGE